MGIVACGDDGGDDGTAVLCKAGELIVTAVAGRFEVQLPQGLDTACGEQWPPIKRNDRHCWSS